ncbi:Calx-beta domain-containing protein [Longibacter salinarum]|nr:Calx-beta domain-containing protein [Longibacter salinarum]
MTYRSMFSALRRSLLPACLLSIALLFAACDSNDMAMQTTVEFGQDTYQVSEAGQSLDVEVVLDSPASEEVTIPITVGGSAIAGVDYEEPASDDVTIASGSTSGTFTITPIDNASIDDQDRTIELLIDADEVDGYTGGATAGATVTITDDEMVGSFTVSFQEASYETNEYNQDTLDVLVEVNQPAPANLQLDFQTGGTATSENYELLNNSIEILAGETLDTIQVAVKDTRSYGESETLTLTLQTPANDAVTIGGTTETDITIVNPVADIATYAPDEDFARLYTYNTFSDVAVPETGRLNTDPSAGVIFDESFAFTIVPVREDPSADPNVFGFGSFLWSEDDFTRSTNMLNMVEFYDDGEQPNTVDEGVSSASAGLYYPSLFRLTPDGPGATTGTVELVQDEIRVYKPDQTDDGVTNPESFVIGISSEGGTYNETEGTINITITFDETAVNNGFVTRRFELSDRRPSS